jgi:hypothetical protein
LVGTHRSDEHRGEYLSIHIIDDGAIVAVAQAFVVVVVVDVDVPL